MNVLGYQSQISVELASLTTFSICSRKAVRLARSAAASFKHHIGNCRQQGFRALRAVYKPFSGTTADAVRATQLL